eukprot:TRINITY_DN11217_c0_g1_i1.p1 TRINITY_DN11217_c0_g1~~TRINITY_DN11217_c0_g1_i1.p1  ORF type:complete len:473 (+),score=105.03 TRINITY_DN11217_c0_g1_i1:66-1484(+)
MADLTPHEKPADDEKEAAKEDLENISLEELKARYLRYRKRTNDWKDKMKSIALKEREQLTATAAQLRETAERLATAERHCAQVERDKHDLEVRFQEILAKVQAQGKARSSEDHANVGEASVVDRELSALRTQLDLQHRQRIQDLERAHADEVATLHRDVAAARRERDQLQALTARVPPTVPPAHDAHAAAEREAVARRLRDLEQRLAAEEKEKAQLVREFEQYRARSQAAFRQAKADEHELQAQRSLVGRLQQQLQHLQDHKQAPRHDAPTETSGGDPAAEELSGRLGGMEEVCLEADQKLNELTERLQLDTASHQTEVRQLQEEVDVLRRQAQKAQGHFQRELERLDLQLGREITRLQGTVKAKAVAVERLCERLGISEADLQDGWLDAPHPQLPPLRLSPRPRARTHGPTAPTPTPPPPSPSATPALVESHCPPSTSTSQPPTWGRRRSILTSRVWSTFPRRIPWSTHTS